MKYLKHLRAKGDHHSNVEHFESIDNLYLEWFDV
jgi:hypothetical protein